ncbi:MAG: hypothetical protein J6B86_04125 [Clostridia bacterium]|nr:hypothetical protein [Clostridia bacterium]
MNNETKKTIRRLDLTRGALVLTLILYIAVALIINSSYLTVDRLMRLRSNVVYALSNSGDTLQYDGEEAVDLQLFQDGYVLLTRNGITVCGVDGNIYSSHTLQYKQPAMKVCGKYILCFDRGGTSWSLLNSFRVLCSGTESADIINGAVSDDGYFAIAAERTEYKGCVTVYNTKGTDLSRWNSDSYLIDAFFTSKNRLTVVFVAPEKEKTHTVFTVFNFKKPASEGVVTAQDTFPLALAQKENGDLEMLTATGAVRFDGEKTVPSFTYPEPSPRLYCQSDGGTMVSYQTTTGTVLVQGFSPEGEERFSLEYPSLVSLGCTDEYYFILTETNLFVLDAEGSKVLEQPNVGYSKLLVSPEVSVLVGLTSIERLDLSTLP